MYNIGDLITWVSSAGKLDGRIVNIVHGLNAAGKMIPWIIVEHKTRRTFQRVMMAGTESHAKMMKIEVL